MAKAALKLSESQENETVVIEDHSEGELELDKIFEANLGDFGESGLPPRRFSKVKDLLDLVGDSRESSLDKIFSQAIDEGERFRAWKESGQPLGELQIFHKKNGELFPIGYYKKLFVVQTMEITVKLDFSQDFQFEIWRCKDDELDFPVYRLGFHDIEKNKKLTINEPLREDIALSIKSEISNDSILIALSVEVELLSEGICERCADTSERTERDTHASSFQMHFSYVEKVMPAFEWMWGSGARGIQYFGGGFATAMILFIAIYSAQIILPDSNSSGRQDGAALSKFWRTAWTSADLRGVSVITRS